MTDHKEAIVKNISKTLTKKYRRAPGNVVADVSRCKQTADVSGLLLREQVRAKG